MSDTIAGPPEVTPEVKQETPAKPTLSPAKPTLSPTKTLAAEATTSYDSRLSQIQANAARYETQLAGLESTLPPKPKFAQTDPMQAFNSLGGVIGVFGSLLSRRPLVSALNASASAMEALKKNSIEEYSTKMQEWDAHYQQVLSTEKLASGAITQILNNDKLQMNEKMALLRQEMASGNASARLALQSEASMMRHANMQEKLSMQYDQLDSRKQEYLTTYFANMVKTVDPALVPSLYGEFGKLLDSNPNAGIADITRLVQGVNGKPASVSTVTNDRTAANIMAMLDPLTKPKGKITYNGTTFTSEDYAKVKDPKADIMALSPNLRLLYDLQRKGLMAAASGSGQPATLTPAKEATLTPAKEDRQSFVTEAAANEAMASGKLKKGDKILIGGEKFTIGE